MSDEKSFYYMKNNDVVGPVSFRNIEELVVKYQLHYDTLIHSGEGDWKPFSQYGREYPEALSFKWLAVEGPKVPSSGIKEIETIPPRTNTPFNPAQVCLTVGIIFGGLGLIAGMMAENLYIALGGVSTFIGWGVIALILRACAIQADARNEKLIAAIRELKDK